MVNIKRTVEVELDDPAFTAEIQSIINRSYPQIRETGLPDDPSTPDKDGSRTAFSTSQRSRDNQIAALANIIALLRTRVDFNPNDAEYKLTAIEAKHAAFVAKNNAAKAAFAALGNATDARARILYNPQTGVLKLVKLIKRRKFFGKLPPFCFDWVDTLTRVARLMQKFNLWKAFQS
jgi:hypothetical protein